jgi:hypothetical protein
MRLRQAVSRREWGWTRKTLEQYGNYLLLTGQEHQVGEVRVFEPPG